MKILELTALIFQQQNFLLEKQNRKDACIEEMKAKWKK
jgi:hypothetical protein